jgi:hypothetical protein
MNPSTRTSLTRAFLRAGNMVDSPRNPKPKTPQKASSVATSAKPCASAAVAVVAPLAPLTSSAPARSSQRNSDIDDILAVNDPPPPPCPTPQCIPQHVTFPPSASPQFYRYFCKRIFPDLCSLGYWRHSRQRACSIFIRLLSPPYRRRRRCRPLLAAMRWAGRRPVGIPCMLQASLYKMRLCCRAI